VEKARMSGPFRVTAASPSVSGRPAGSTSRDIGDEERGVAFGTVAGEPLLLDVYRPPGRATLRPAVVCVHGGGMWTGSRADMAGAARELAHAGYVTFATDYRLVDAATGRNRWPAQLDDVQRAVRWIRANAARYGVDPGRVGAYGWSAGGQLAALLGTRDARADSAVMAAYSSRVVCVVDLAGDVDLAAYTRPPASDEVVALLGGTRTDVPERYRDASPLSWIDERTAPFLIVHGTVDDVVPVEQSRRLVSALRAAGVEVEYIELTDAGHGDLTWSRIGPAVLAFLERHLRPSD
jgi:acetyl esterase/lipase